MKVFRKALVVCAVFLVPVAVLAGGMLYPGAMMWEFDGIDRTKQWPSPNGRMNYQGQISGIGTAVDLWPPTGEVRQHSISEFTVYRTGWWEFDTTGVERLSLSAMADDHYRISIERDDKSQWRPLIVCFDHTVPGSDHVCIFKINPTGVFINVNGKWKPVAHQ